MEERIELLKTISFYLGIFSVILIAIAAYVVWKNDLLDYYRIKRGKPRKKIDPIPQNKTKVSQYYSDYHPSVDNGHEIVEASVEDDSGSFSTNLSGNLNAVGVTRPANYDVRKQKDFDRRYVEGEEETTLLEDNSSDPTEELTFKVDDGAEETTLLQDALYAETEIVDLKEYSDDLLNNPHQSDEGEEETTLLQNNQDVHFDSIPKTSSDDGSEETTILTLDDEDITTLLDADGSEETQLLTKEIDETETTLLDAEGDEETTLLSASNDKKVATASSNLWGPQILSFEVDRAESITVNYEGRREEKNPE